MNRHDTDLVALAFGLLFAGIVGWSLVWQWVRITPPAAGWFVAGALLLFGVLGIATTVASARGRTGDDPDRDPAHPH